MKTETPQFPMLLDRLETRKEIAERIVRWHFHLGDNEKLSKMYGHGTLADAIEAALNAERERCAKIIQDRIDQYALLRSVEGDVVRVFGKQMIEAIRGSNH